MNFTPSLKIVSAEYLEDYKILVVFNNGAKKTIDFNAIVSEGRGITHKLRDLYYFRNFTLDPFSIDWNNEIGFAPEYLYRIGEDEAEQVGIVAEDDNIEYGK